MAKRLKVGVVGCGNISATYFKYAPMFKSIGITACADLDPRVAEARASKHWATSDKIRDALNALDIVVKDGKEGVSWSKA